MLFDQRPILTVRRSFCEKVKNVEIIGLHKLAKPKTTYRYMFLITWIDESQVTIYRKYKDVKLFQAQLSADIASNDEHREASRYLNKLKRKTRPLIVVSSMGTAQRLRLIDSLNTYFEVVTHYFSDLNNLPVLKDFLLPSNEDKDSTNWSKNGKTYFYTTPKSSLHQNDDSVTNDVAMKRCLSAVNLLSVNQSPKKEFRRKSASMVLTFEEDVDGGVYIADEDHIPREEDANHNVIALRKGEKVQVIRKSETGWWFVKKMNGFVSKDSYGYVPGSYLKFCMKDNVFDSVSSSTSSSRSSSFWVDNQQEDPVYETICVPMNVENSNRALPETPIQKVNKINRKSKSLYLSLKSFNSSNSDELSFEKDELVEVVKKNTDGWWLARHNDLEGFVPATFLIKYNQPSFNSALSRSKFEEIFARKI